MRHLKTTVGLAREREQVGLQNFDSFPYRLESDLNNKNYNNDTKIITIEIFITISKKMNASNYNSNWMSNPAGKR